MRPRHVVLTHDSEQDVLGADVVVAQRERLLHRELDLLPAGRERDLTGRDLVAPADDARDLASHLLEGDAESLEHLGGKTLFLAEQPEQEVLGPDVVVLQCPRFVLGENDDLTRFFGEPLEHGFEPTEARRADRAQTPLVSSRPSAARRARGRISL